MSETDVSFKDPEAEKRFTRPVRARNQDVGFLRFPGCHQETPGGAVDLRTEKPMCSGPVREWHPLHAVVSGVVQQLLAPPPQIERRRSEPLLTAAKLAELRGPIVVTT